MIGTFVLITLAISPDVLRMHLLEVPTCLYLQETVAKFQRRGFDVLSAVCLKDVAVSGSVVEIWENPS